MKGIEICPIDSIHSFYTLNVTFNIQKGKLKSSTTHVWIVQGKDSYFMLWSGQRENTKSMVKASYYFEWKKTVRALNSMVLIHHACDPLH